MPKRKKQKPNSSDSYIRKTITITTKQNDYIRRNYINLSRWVQDKLGKHCEGVIICQGKRKKQK